MATTKKPVNEIQIFWETVFQQTNLTQQLMEIAGKNNPSTGFEFDLSGYGKVLITAKPAVPLGTNFMNDVFITHASDQMGLQYTGFVKVLPSNPSRLAAGFIGGYYQRESVVYQQWLPELKEIRRSKNLKNSEVPLNVAEAYFVNLVFSKDGNHLENETVCVLEELKSKGYRMATSARSADGIDLNHAKIALVTYANYHALSVANQRRLVKMDGSRDLSPAYEIFQKDPNYISPAIVYRTIVLPQYIKVLRHFQRGEGQLPDLEKIWNWESFVDSGPLSCLLHGDSWNNNLLFRYPSETNNEPEEMLLIDWQIARFGHLSHDLGYFLFSSTSSSFRKQYLNQLLNDYYTSLSTALANLGIDLSREGYNRESFMEETKQRYTLMMMIALFILPILLDDSKAKDHTLKSDSTVSNETSAAEDQSEELDEEGTKDGWKNLFEFNSVISNSILSQRALELITDVKEMVGE